MTETGKEAVTKCWHKAVQIVEEIPEAIMLDLTSIQATAPSRDASAQSARKTATQAEDVKDQRGFETEYDAASPKQEKNADDLDNAEAEDKGLIREEISDDEKVAVKTGTDGTESDLEGEIPDLREAGTSDQQPPVAMGEVQKALETNAYDEEPPIEKTRMQAAEDVKSAQAGRDTNREGSFEKAEATLPAVNNKASEQKSGPLGKTTAETIVMTRAIEQASKGETAAGNGSLPLGERLSTQAGTTASNAAQVAPVAPLEAKKDTARNLPAEEPRAGRRDEVQMPATDRQTRQSTPNAAYVSVQTSQPPLQPLSKLEAKWEKVDLMAASPLEGETVGPWDSRTATTTSPAALSQILSRAETPTMIARQMAEALQRLPDRPVEIALNPDELGRVRMSITASDAGITVGVLAERPETLDLMRRNIEQLTREFQSLGYENISFSFADGHTPQNFDDQGTNASDQVSTKLDLESDADIATSHPTKIASSGVDIRL